MFEWVILCFVCLVFVSIVIDTLRLGISPMPSSLAVTSVVVKQLPVEVGQCCLEAGCGWGTLLFAMAKQHPDVRFVGVEASIFPYLFCVLRKMFTRTENVELCWQDVFTYPFGRVDVLVCYLFPAGMDTLKEKCEDELKQGAYVVSHTFRVPTWEPVDVVRLHDLYNTPVYTYQWGVLSGSGDTSSLVGEKNS
ncbi:MAG TPA: SAM-dependent methyltransferase [Myxococcales bacterium]|nr:SAM-dependent methyltransferase [Deltaproteobacteria bacterium]MBU51681.1 SAM-dependent methyltransferase [Deltaproteobacteria bacterium]HAA56431.1 SAM-dependent methyltransferase [Myxococcales bacterium]|tara:strand:- start:487 stop:1065 length:579 start_codon:yes stop_codon:yes gene_type:complete